MQPDNELLRQYAQARSEDAFAELVKRHINLVYSAALRQVGGDAHLAQDVAQTVFTDLARKAASLARRESLTGWLYTSAYFAANKMARTEHRRREREEQFMREPSLEPALESDWEKLRPILDAAMHDLKKPDREAVLLRYFENRPYAEVGTKLGLNENAARMRVDRALEKLRVLLAKRAVISTAALASVISANGIQMAPPALAGIVAGSSLAAAGAGTSIAFLKFMTLTQLKAGLGAIVVAGAATSMVLQHQKQQQLQSERESLRRQIEQLKTEKENFSNQLASDGNSKAMTDAEFNELLRLRGEVSALRSQTNQLQKLRDENLRLRESLTAPTPDRAQPAPDAEQQRAFAMSKLDTARQSVLGMMEYAGDHGGQFPTNFDQAAAYYGNSDARTNFDQFEIVYQGAVSDVANPSTAIVVRASQPWQVNGKWAEAYGFVDGHAEIHVADSTENLDEWERQHVALLKNQ